MRPALLLVLLLGSCSSPYDQDRMILEANAWKTGDPLPGYLLEHRDSREYDGTCFGVAGDSLGVFSEIENYDLLLDLACRPGVHEKIHELGVEKALLIAGPGRFFDDVQRRIEERPSLREIPRYQHLLERAAQPNVRFRGLFGAKEQLEGFQRDLQRGVRWEDAKGLGLFGTWVCFSGKLDAGPYRLAKLPEHHLLPLIFARKAETLILDDEAKGHSILYQVLETYPPAYPDKSDLLKYVDGSGRIRNVATASEWFRRQRHVLGRFQMAAGPMPAESEVVPLDVKIHDEVRMEKYTRRTISFAVEAGDRVPAFLLIPNDLAGSVPAVLCLHQTTPLGKAEPAGMGIKNLAYAAELAERGFVTLAPDYPGFGDYKIDVYAMGYASATMKGIWNHRRAVDLLQSLPFVKAESIGVIGHSLGGHNSLFVAAFEPRIKAVVTSCGFNAFPKYFGGNLKGWSHKGYMPRIDTEYGKDPKRMPFDFTEILGAIAPRALFINAPLKDSNFEVTGVQDCVAAAAPVYELLGAKDAIKAVYPDAAHDFPPDVRNQAYDFLAQALK